MTEATRVSHLAALSLRIRHAILAASSHAALADTPVPVRILAVRALPRSGRPAELLDYVQISRKHIASAVKNMLR